MQDPLTSARSYRGQRVDEVADHHVLPCTVSFSANHALVCSGWWFIVIIQNRWSSASVIVLPGQCL